MEIEKLERLTAHMAGCRTDLCNGCAEYISDTNGDVVDADKARAREDALLEAIKKIGVELPHGGWCFCPDNWIGVNHTSKCDATNSLIREIEGSR